jgi:hypothetical protein
MAAPDYISPPTTRRAPLGPGWVAFFLESLRRLLVILSLTLWFGGFTFYSLVVIHTGHRVLGSRVEVGFLTQEVTRWLNLIGLPTLLLLLWNVFAGWRSQRRIVRIGLVSTWAIIAGVQVALFALHPAIDRLLDPETHTITHKAQFKSLHLLYMNLSTAQWIAVILYVCACLIAWRRVDAQSQRMAPYQPDRT